MILALATGLLFAADLHLPGMTDTAGVQGFLDFFGAWNPTLAFVTGGAILPMALAWRMTSGRMPLVGGSFPARLDPVLDPQPIIAAVLLGAGGGLVGLCPGPAIASLSHGGIMGAVFLGAMALVSRARGWLDSRQRLA